MKYQRIDIATIDKVKFKLVVPTKKNKDKYPKYYLEYTANGKQYQSTKNIKTTYIEFERWAKSVKLDSAERHLHLIKLFQINVNAIVNSLDIVSDGEASAKRINIYSSALETINLFYTYQQNQHKLGELTGIANYSDRNKKLNAFFSSEYPNILIKELTAAVWNDFRTFLKKQNKANSTVNQYITYVKSWYNWVINYYEVPIINHTNKLKKLDVSQQEKKYKELATADISNFFNAVGSDVKWLRLELIARLVGENTIRPVQVRNIQAKNINLEDGTIQIHDKKGKKWRTIVVTDRVKVLIEHIYNSTKSRGGVVEPEDYLIGGFNAFKRGKPYTQNMVKDLLIEPFRQEFPKLKKVNIYDFKHTSITRASKGGNLLEVQKRAGHSKITTTQIYDRSASVSNPISIEELMLIE